MMAEKKDSGHFTNRPSRSLHSNRRKTPPRVVARPIAQLKLEENNPRNHSPDHIQRLSRSLVTFGFTAPVLIDKNMKVIAGHGRILAAEKLGWSDVPCLKLDNLTEAQAKAYRIADNRLAECSEWNERLLAENLSELSKLDLNFDLDVVGFDIGEIDFRIQQLSDDGGGTLDADDAVPAIKSEAVSRQGDTWQLGEHLVHCGNALEVDSYKDLRGKAVMILSDLPYNVPIDGFTTGLGSMHHREFPMASGEMTEQEFATFLEAACRALATHSVDGSLHYLFIDWRHIRELTNAGMKVYSGLQNVCVWVKDNAGMGSFYRSRHELIVVFKNGRAPHRNNVQLGKYGRGRSNVWEYPTVRSFTKSGDENDLLKAHPTVKPTRLLADAIMDASARGELILDGFLGSGSSLIAAQRTERRCFGVELDPLYVDTSVRRWQALTGLRAIHLATGRSFHDTEANSEVRHGR
jgi:DNA modification methylase